MEDKMICGFCTHYDDDEVWCPYKGEVYPEDTCSNWTGDVELLTEEDLEAQKVDRAERENHRKDVEGEIV